MLCFSFFELSRFVWDFLIYVGCHQIIFPVTCFVVVYSIVFANMCNVYCGRPVDLYCVCVWNEWILIRIWSPLPYGSTEQIRIKSIFGLDFEFSRVFHHFSGKAQIKVVNMLWNREIIYEICNKMTTKTQFWCPNISDQRGSQTFLLMKDDFFSHELCKITSLFSIRNSYDRINEVFPRAWQILTSLSSLKFETFYEREIMVVFNQLMLKNALNVNFSNCLLFCS